jgi:hypothetical protein
MIANDQLNKELVIQFLSLMQNSGSYNYGTSSESVALAQIALTEAHNKQETTHFLCQESLRIARRWIFVG